MSPSVCRPRTDFRPTWRLEQSEPVAGNYYPVNSRAFIKVTPDVVMEAQTRLLSLLRVRDDAVFRTRRTS